MSDHKFLSWFNPYHWTAGSIILGKITAMTSSDILAFGAVLTTSLTAILTALKIYEWFYKWRRRNDPPPTPKPHKYEKEEF